MDIERSLRGREFCTNEDELAHPCQGAEFCTNTAYWVVDPYIMEVYDTVVHRWYCENCFSERCDEV